MKRLMEAFYVSALPDRIGKQIPNIVIGQCTKRVNRNERYLFCCSADEAVDVCGVNVVEKNGFTGRRGMKETVTRKGWAIYAHIRLYLLQAYDALVAAGRTAVGFLPY